MKHKTLIENTFPLPLLLGYETSKPVPIVIATLLQRERVLTFHKCRKYREIGFWKPVLVAKFAENDPQMASKACLKDGKWTPQIPCPIGNHFSWGLAYFARQTKLKWTKNFRALYFSLTKCTGRGRGFDASALNAFQAFTMIIKPEIRLWSLTERSLGFVFTAFRRKRQLTREHCSWGCGVVVMTLLLQQGTATKSQQKQLSNNK